MRFEPSTLQEVNASPFAKGCFERTRCLRFCEKIMEEGYHLQLKSLFAIRFSMGKAIITCVEFNLSTNVIYLATCIPSHGQKWFKGMDIDLEYYKLFLKPHARQNPEYIFLFRHLLNKYAPLMRLIMKYLTCEGRFFRFYRYHIMLLMHFTLLNHLTCHITCT